MGYRNEDILCKEKIKKILNKVPFKNINIIIAIMYILSIVIIVFSSKTNFKIIGKITNLTSFLLIVLSISIYSIRYFIDDIDKIVVMLIIIIFFIFIIGMVGKFLLFFIPRWFPENTNTIFELYIYSFTSIGAALLGILGTYFGANYTAKKSFQAIEKQINQEKEYNKIQQEKNRKMIIRIIAKFLKEEIIDNKKNIEGSNFYNGLNKGFKVQYGYNLKDKINFNDYNNVKYELIKYTNEKLVEDVIDLYGLLHLLVRYDDINKYNEKEYNKIINLQKRINSLLNEIEKSSQ